MGNETSQTSVPPQFKKIRTLDDSTLRDYLRKNSKIEQCDLNNKNSEHKITGSISLSFIKNILNVSILSLYNNQLTGNIPKELSNLINLQELYLSSNQISGEIPKELSNLINLQRLSLWGNQISGEIPKELSNLINLQELFVIIINI